MLVLANLESYNAVLLKQGKDQRERMELLRQLALQQLRTLEARKLAAASAIRRWIRANNPAP